MNYKAAFLVILVLLDVALGGLVLYCYFDRVNARLCSSDLQCGTEGFCDEEQRCQFPEEIVRSEQKNELVVKHNIAFGLIFVFIGVFSAVFILKPKGMKRF